MDNFVWLHPMSQTMSPASIEELISPRTFKSRLPKHMFLKIPSGKQTVCYGKSPFIIGKSTISMAIFHSNASHYQRVSPFLMEKLWENHHFNYGKSQF